MRICKIEGCSKKHHALGLCNTHYRMFKKTGDPFPRINEQHGLKKTKEYESWVHMKQRCSNQNLKSYKDYGGRGITICDRWLHSFTAFYEDMGDKPFPEAQIDRKENDKGYYKDNCHWVTSQENSQNRRNNKITPNDVITIREEFDHKVYGTITQLAERFKVSRTTIKLIGKRITWSNI